VLHRVQKQKVLCCTEFRNKKFSAEQSSETKSVLLHRVQKQKVFCCTEFRDKKCSAAQSSETKSVLLHRVQKQNVDFDFRKKRILLHMDKKQRAL
jgi:RPA family protein